LLYTVGILSGKVLGGSTPKGLNPSHGELRWSKRRTCPFCRASKEQVLLTPSIDEAKKLVLLANVQKRQRRYLFSSKEKVLLQESEKCMSCSLSGFSKKWGYFLWRRAV
jgi:hypothetical protein